MPLRKILDPMHIFHNYDCRYLHVIGKVNNMPLTFELNIHNLSRVMLWCNFAELVSCFEM